MLRLSVISIFQLKRKSLSCDLLCKDVWQTLALSGDIHLQCLDTRGTRDDVDNAIKYHSRRSVPPKVL